MSEITLFVMLSTYLIRLTCRLLELEDTAFFTQHFYFAWFPLKTAISLSVFFCPTSVKSTFEVPVSHFTCVSDSLAFQVPSVP